MRPVVGVVALVLAVTPWATSCGSDDDYSAYCDAVKAHRDGLTETLAEGDAGLLAAIPTFEDLRDQAPADIRDDWTTVVDALTGLQEALDDAGVKASDYKQGVAPKGVTAAQRKAIAAAATKVSSTTTQKASLSVQQQARDVCHTPLTL